MHHGSVGLGSSALQTTKKFSHADDHVGREGRAVGGNVLLLANPVLAEHESIELPRIFQILQIP